MQYRQNGSKNLAYLPKTNFFIDGLCNQSPNLGGGRREKFRVKLKHLFFDFTWLTKIPYFSLGYRKYRREHGYFNR
jgi:hypothetical protein